MQFKNLCPKGSSTSDTVFHSFFLKQIELLVSDLVLSYHEYHSAEILVSEAMLYISFSCTIHVHILVSFSFLGKKRITFFVLNQVLFTWYSRISSHISRFLFPFALNPSSIHSLSLAILLLIRDPKNRPRSSELPNVSRT